MAPFPPHRALRAAQRPRWETTLTLHNFPRQRKAAQSNGGAVVVTAEAPSPVWRTPMSRRGRTNRKRRRFSIPPAIPPKRPLGKRVERAHECSSLFGQAACAFLSPCPSIPLSLPPKPSGASMGSLFLPEGPGQRGCLPWPAPEPRAAPVTHKVPLTGTFYRSHQASASPSCGYSAQRSGDRGHRAGLG